MVVSGTVSVTIAGHGSLNRPITVNARNNWHTMPALPVQVSDGTLSWTGPDSNMYASPLKSPPAAAWPLGWSEYSINVTNTSATVPTGANQGYLYISSVTYPSSFYFHWELATDLATSTSTFAENQCGTNGYISYTKLAANVIRHESCQIAESHWINYSSAIQSVGNDLAAWAEPQTAIPGTSTTGFLNLVNDGMSSRMAQTSSDIFGAGEPLGADYSIDGSFQGYVNYAPYNNNDCHQAP
jgi:hypothetical protein